MKIGYCHGIFLGVCAGIILGTVAFFLGSCGTTNTISYPPVPKTSQRIIPCFIDKEFSQPDLMDILGGIQSWNVALNGNVYLDVIDSSFDLEPGEIQEIIERHGLMFLQVHLDCDFFPITSPNAIAWTDSIAGNRIWIVKERVVKGTLKEVTMHEIGHALGAHDSYRPGLMYYAVDTSIQWECVDLFTATEVASHFAFMSLDMIKYCEKHP